MLRPILLALLFVWGCDALATRSPEAPAGAATFVQPDTPETVLANLVASLRERSPSTYRRSLDPNLTYRPSREAASRDGFWQAWSAPEEEAYFRTLTSAAQPGAAFSLSLATTTPSEVTADAFVLDTDYVLITPHNRAEAPTTVRGRLRWRIERAPDGLWRLVDWTDEATDGPTWSDLKAAFFQ